MKSHIAMEFADTLEAERLRRGQKTKRRKSAASLKPRRPRPAALLKKIHALGEESLYERVRANCCPFSGFTKAALDEHAALIVLTVLNARRRAA